MIIDKFGALSYSSLKSFKECPASFIIYKQGKQIKKTAAMIFGSQCEEYVFGDSTKYISKSERPEAGKNMSSSKNKEWKLQMLSEGKEIIDCDDLEAMKRIKDGVFNDRAVMELLQHKYVTQEYFKYEAFNFEFHGYKDLSFDDFFIDFKTCTNAHPNKVKYDFMKFGYGLQAAIYSNHRGQEAFYLFADKNGNVSLNRVTEETIGYNWGEIEELTTGLKKCIITNNFPSFGFWSNDGIFEI